MQQHWFRDALSLIDGSESSTGLATRRMALGAAVGGLALAHLEARHLPWVGAPFALAALVWMRWSTRPD